MTAGNGTDATDPHTAYITSGAGSWGETGDSCGDPGSYFYSNGGNGGFNIVTVNETAFEVGLFETVFLQQPVFLAVSVLSRLRRKA